MASLFKKSASSFWYGNWRNGNIVKTRSTKIPIKGEVINGIKEAPSQARVRAQRIADGFEAADKEGIHAVKVKETMSSLAKEEVTEIPSVKDFLNGYVKSREGQLSRGTIINTKTAIKLFLKHLKQRASLPISTVRRSDVKDFVNAQLKSVRQGTVKKYMTALSPAFMSALDSEIIDKSPFFRIVVPSSTAFKEVNKEAFSKEEVMLMLKLLPSDWRSMVLFCLYLGGQRLGDIASLRWDQIDVQNRMVSLKTGKTGRAMKIPIVSVLLDHINSLRRFDEFVHPAFAEKHQRSGSSYLSQQFIRELEFSGIVEKTPSVHKGRTKRICPKSFHCLRATAATLLHTAGVDHALAQEIVGHDSEKAHQLYIRPDSEQKRMALEKLVGEIGSGNNS